MIDCAANTVHNYRQGDGDGDGPCGLAWAHDDLSKVSYPDQVCLLRLSPGVVIPAIITCDQPRVVYIQKPNRSFLPGHYLRNASTMAVLFKPGISLSSEQEIILESRLRAAHKLHEEAEKEDGHIHDTDK